MVRSDISAFIGYVWKSHRALILFGMVFIATIQVLLIYFNSTLDIAPMVELFLSQLPPQVNEMYGEEILSQITAEGTVAFGLEHPLVLTLITFISISMVSRNIASGSSNKLMEIILAHPFKRKTMFLSLYFFSMSILALLTLSAFVGAFISVYFFHELDDTILENMIKADVNAYLLHLFIMSYAMFFSIYFKDISKAVRVSALITLVFYFIDILSELWAKLSFTKVFNFFSYFDPPEIMVGDGFFLRNSLVLLLLSLVLFLVSYRTFNKKDIF